ncbi:MAG: hypothetical protein P8163_05565, partial [Candidatus Thiodiazotropha sp.]
ALQRRHALPQACHSRCSVIHPAGDITIEAIFFKISNLLVEWSGQLIFLGSIGSGISQLQNGIWLSRLCFSADLTRASTNGHPSTSDN